MKAQAAAPAQLDPSLLPEGEFWTYPCQYCPPNTPPMQGGLAGLRAHIATVHPGRTEQSDNRTLW